MSTSNLQRSTYAGKAALRAHQGNGFVIIANTYPTLELVLCENVQNALDAGATRIRVEINYREGSATTRDNGGGATKRRMSDALGQIGRTQKKEDALGRFGIGIIAALGKCERFTFTSCCPTEGFWGYLRWVFITEAIQTKSDDIDLDVEYERSVWNMNSPVNKGHNQTPVWWTSQMKLERLRPETEIGRVTMDSLKKALLARFGIKMRRQRAKVEIEILPKSDEKQFQEVTAKDYAGDPLPVVVIENPEAGKVRFRLFIAPRTANGKRMGIVCVGESDNDYRFPVRTFRSSVTNAMRPEILEALREGTLEGEITGEKVTLKRDRDAFEQNDALLGFCIVLEEWYDKYGLHALEDARERRKDERFQHLGLQALEKLATVLDCVPNLREAMGMFKLGTTGLGHTEVRQTAGIQDTKSLSPRGKHSGEKSEETGENKKKESERSVPEKENKGHNPLTATGPIGRHRTLVRKGSFGLQLSFDGMEESLDLWQLEPEEGILRFNPRHDLWEACDRSDRYLVELQIFVAIQALSLQLQPEPMRETQRQVLDILTENQVKGWILNISRYDGAIRPSKKKKTAGEIVTMKS
jgi:hypothetical protein